MSTAPLDPAIVAEIRAAITRARLGDLAGALSIAERALLLGKDQAAVHALLGMFYCQSGDFATGVNHLHKARAANPADVTIAANLAAALIETGDIAGATAICTADLARLDSSQRLWRMRGYLLQSTGDYAGAIEAYRAVVSVLPEDFETWNNLGNAYVDTGDAVNGIAALDRAVSLRPDIAPIRMNHAAALTNAGLLDEAAVALDACARDFPEDPKPLVELAAVLKQLARDEEALTVLKRAVTLDPTDADLMVKLGMEQVIAWAMEEAEQSFRGAIAVDAANAEAHIMLGVLLEHTNQAGDFPALVTSAETLGVADGALHFLRALTYRREQRFAEGLTELAMVPADIEPARTAQLAGQFHDRLGDAQAAFAAFNRMNDVLALDSSDPLARAADYRAKLRADRAVVTPEWFAEWRVLTPPSADTSPAFLVGFPRSGTTLLDTMLMGHPNVQVLEERPPITKVESALGGLERLAALDDAGLSALRACYFDEVRKHLDIRPGSLIVDKFPLHLNKVPLIHRLFPDARFILALRHPCDVVLSCYNTNFRLNNAMSNFLDLKDSATVYDLSFGFWEQCRAIMPIRVHPVYYERVVVDSEAELRPLFAYLGLDWHDGVLDHRQTAAARGVISTASYAQVTEPIYQRASGRWERYRAQLDPVLPILLPWAERFGYRV